jgi:predicted metallopeptidase
MDWIEAPEVEDVAREIIAENYPHLAGVDMRFVFNEKEPSSCGKALWGRARKITGLPAHLAGSDHDFFVLEIVYSVWKQLAPAKRKALVDHELAHFWRDEDEDGEEKLSLLPHDLEEFAAIVRRHGLWREDVKLMAEAIESAQTEMAFGVEDGVREVAAGLHGLLREHGATMTVKTDG